VGCPLLSASSLLACWPPSQSDSRMSVEWRARAVHQVCDGGPVPGCRRAGGEVTLPRRGPSLLSSMGIREKLVGLQECLQFDNRWALLMQRALARSQRLVVYRLQGVEFVVDHGAGDPSGTRAALIGPMYRRLLPAANLPRSNALRVMDLGANGGGFTLLILCLGYTIEQVVAVEFNAATASRLRFNLDRNLQAANQVLVAAITGDGRAIDIALGDGNTGDNIYRPSASGTGRRVQGTTFDEVAARLGPGRIDLVKMDIEGAETEVLLGLSSFRLRDVNALVVEIHDEKDIDPLRVKLASMGLRLTASPDCGRRGVFLFTRTVTA
jgi:FkbM family methyltransferase